MSHPLIQSALADLDLDLEAELKRYRYHYEDVLPIDLEIVDRDFDPFSNSSFSSGLDSDLELDPEDKNLDLNSDLSLPIFELSYLDDLSSGLSADLSEDLENNLEEEFCDRLMPRESDKFTEDFTEEFIENTSETALNQNPKELNPNLLSPLGIIAMILLLVSSAAVGYLLVDPSGLNRLIEQEDSNKSTSSLPNSLPVSLMERLELFQKTSNKVEPVPFVDFSVNKPAKDFSKSPILNLPTLIPPIGIGRSFEPPVPPISPITVEPENRIKLAPVPDRLVNNPTINAQKLTKSQIRSQKALQLDKNPNLQSERTLPNQEIIPQSKPVRSQVSKEQNLNPAKPLAKTLISPSIIENKPVVEPVNPKPNTETAVIEPKPEVVQEFN